VAGIYGVMSYAVASRTREFAIRLALGADAGGVLRTVPGHGALLIGIGLTIGLTAAGGAANSGGVGCMFYSGAAGDATRPRHRAEIRIG
jgi:ABC-type antimicrobial peptide transport system permease subunit